MKERPIIFNCEIEDIRSAAEKKRAGDPRADVKAAKRAAKKNKNKLEKGLRISYTLSKK